MYDKWQGYHCSLARYEVYAIDLILSQEEQISC